MAVYALVESGAQKIRLIYLPYPKAVISKCIFFWGLPVHKSWHLDTRYWYALVNCKSKVTSWLPQFPPWNSQPFCKTLFNDAKIDKGRLFSGGETWQPRGENFPLDSPMTGMHSPSKGCRISASLKRRSWRNAAGATATSALWSWRAPCRCWRSPIASNIHAVWWPRGWRDGGMEVRKASVDGTTNNLMLVMYRTEKCSCSLF